MFASLQGGLRSMFKCKKIVGAALSFGAFIWKSGLLIFLFIGGMVLFVAAKRAGSSDAVMFYQNIGVGVSTTALVLLIMYWWQMDSTGDMQQDLKELKKQNKALEDKLTTTNTLLQQLVDKASQPTT